MQQLQAAREAGRTIACTQQQDTQTGHKHTHMSLCKQRSTNRLSHTCCWVALQCCGRVSQTIGKGRPESAGGRGVTTPLWQQNTRETESSPGGSTRCNRLYVCPQTNNKQRHTLPRHAVQVLAPCVLPTHTRQDCPDPRCMCRPLPSPVSVHTHMPKQPRQ